MHINIVLGLHVHNCVQSKYLCTLINIQKVQQYPQEYKQLERNLSEVRDRKPQENGYFKASQPPSNNPEKYNEGYKLPSIKQNNEKVRYREKNFAGEDSEE